MKADSITVSFIILVTALRAQRVSGRSFSMDDILEVARQYDVELLVSKSNIYFKLKRLEEGGVLIRSNAAGVRYQLGPAAVQLLRGAMEVGVVQ